MRPAICLAGIICGLAALVVRAEVVEFADERDGDTCLMLSCRCLAKGGNSFLYYEIGTRPITIKSGDRLEYDVFLDPDAPEPKGGIELLAGAENLRDSGARDREDRRSHGDTLLPDALGKWIGRSIDLASLTDKTLTHVLIQQEGDKEGRYNQFIDNIRIVHADGTSASIYTDGRPASSRIAWKSGYSDRALLAVTERARVKPGPELMACVADLTAREDLFHRYNELSQHVELIEKFLKASHREDLIPKVREALSVEKPDEFRGTAEEYAAKLHAAHHKLDHAHPVMQEYTGELVGHAHIDLQWLWEWPEGIECSRATFAQACKFMDEFPEFTFSQSSAAVYEAIEQYFPDLFSEMKVRIAEGRFEPVGGRWCEGDTNLISAESHARHLLYGQRYFRSRFGKTCTVGWEPDTFGHCWTMPSILKAAGIDSYYFCRAGKNIPLFWWEGPDGSRVLAFDEPATGSWYNSDISDAHVKELLDFYEKTGLKELMWVYGVGNHGGGPTREMIQRALEWQKDKSKPRVKFATASAFFAALREKDLSKLPVVKDELGFVFRGCYTTHGDAKRLNRDAEAALTSAETVALFANQSGYPYPAWDFARAWETVCIHHHHDTLPGSGIHEAYENTHQQLGAVISKAEWITRSALRHIAARVDPAGEGIGKIVFNPTGWPRSEVVAWPASKADEGKSLRLVGPGGSASVQHVKADDGTPHLIAWTRDTPPFGYAIHRLAEGDVQSPRDVRVAEDADTIKLIDPDALTVTISRATGQLTSVIDVNHCQLLIGASEGHRLEAHMEEPHGMSAWELGKIVEIIPIDKVESIEVLERGPVRARVRVTRKFRDTSITTDISLLQYTHRVEFDTRIDWREYGTKDKPSPTLRVSFPLVEKGKGEARYSIPFGDIVRPADGQDVPALTWASLTGPEGGAALLNDSKHAYAATTEGELQLTLIRASYDPDPMPDQYLQRIRYALVPCWPDGSGYGILTPTTPAALTRAGLAFNQPLLVEDVITTGRNAFGNPRADGALPQQASLLSLDQLADAVPTCLKRAEDDSDAVLRVFLESPSAATGAIVSERGISRMLDVNLLEDSPNTGASAPPTSSKSVPLALKPYEIRTLKLKLGAAGTSGGSE